MVKKAVKTKRKKQTRLMKPRMGSVQVDLFGKQAGGISHGRKVVCALCGKPIPGSHTMVDDKHYHPACFTSKQDFEYDMMQIWPGEKAKIYWLAGNPKDGYTSLRQR